MTQRASRRRLALSSSAVAAAMLLAAACSSSSGGAKASATNTDPACAPFAAYMGHSGKTVTMFGSIISPESDSLAKSWAQFESCTGIKIQYEGSNSFEQQLPVRVQGGSAPNLALIPQPGLVAQMVKTGSAVPAPAAVAANVDKYWNPAWKAYSTVDGKFYGAPMSANMKSLVWYSPAAFKKAGYAVPTTWAGLMALSAKMASAGGAKPWCGGIGSGTATGWPATDWLEEIVLGTFGGDVYDQWVAHTVKFDSPQITQAMNTMAGWMRNPAWVNAGWGDTKTIATTSFQDAGKPILTNKCYMLQQASFYEAQWPKGTTVSATGDVFAFKLPGVNPAIPTPVEGGGEFVTAFSSKPEVQAVQTYLSTPDWATSRIKVAPGWVSANQGVDPSVYTDPIDKLSAQYLTDKSSTFRFDASDEMPAAVGSGAEWTQMTAFFATNKSVSDTLKAIDAAWPSS
jgi:alpha-glucoside transport system substrate-binding protein